MKNFIIYLLLTIFILLYSCSSPKIYRDDAVRIKKDKVQKYNINPYTNTPRNGNTLRGEILKIEVEVSPDSCPINNNTKYLTNTYVLFIDSVVKKQKLIEKIPIEDIILIGQNTGIPTNKYNNINYFETYNNPLLPLELREVPVDTILKNPCIIPCPCEPISINIPCLLCFECPKRQLDWWFLEGKLGYAFYNDINKNKEIVGNEDYIVDLAVGLRIGKSKRWGLGLIFFSGVSTYDLLDSNYYKRPSANLYFRYDLLRDFIKRDNRNTSINENKKELIYYDTIFTKTYDGCLDSLILIPKVNYTVIQNLIDNKTDSYEDLVEIRPCLNPFIYGLLGASIDKFSLDLIKIFYNPDCQKYVPEVKIPINYGFGIGIEYPLSESIDLSIDIGFRSISYGFQEFYRGNIIPTERRINSFVFRFGLVY